MAELVLEAAKLLHLNNFSFSSGYFKLLREKLYELSVYRAASLPIKLITLPRISGGR